MDNQAFALIAYSARLRVDYPTLEFVTDYYVKSVHQQRDKSTVVSYGDKTPTRCIEKGIKSWFPSATSEKQAVKLMERMRNTGFLLELALGLLMAVRTRLYAEDACLTYYDKAITVRTILFASVFPSRLFVCLSHDSRTLESLRAEPESFLKIFYSLEVPTALLTVLTSSKILCQ